VQRSRLTRITAAASLPLAVTLAEAKAQCSVEGTFYDDLITRYIRAAARAVENFSDVMIGEQQWKLTLDAFTDTIELPIGPVASIDEVEYDDADGVAQLLSGTAWTLDLTSRPQWLLRNSDADWPALFDAQNVVRITFTCGSDTIDDELALAVLNTVAAWHENRSGGALPDAVMEALQTAGYRMVRI
jgi:uncharacterized phiE125 gp8 family phage protein